MKYMKRRGLKLFAVAALLPMMASASGPLSQNNRQESKPGNKIVLSLGEQATAKQVEQLVREFLANVPRNDKKIFEDFFADDVLYTRAAGVTVTKSDILKNIDVRAANEPAATYAADDVTVHPYGNMAVINFRLVQRNGAQTNYFRNTGTFVKRNGKWQAVAWQATKVPEAGK
jgi:ketosteroid isomerase-like protein